MTTLYELYDFLEKTDTESLIQKITDVSIAINEDFGDGYRVRFLAFLNKIENLQSLMKYDFDNALLVTTPKVEKHNNKSETPIEMNPSSEKDGFTESINGTAEKVINSTDKYKGMESGDIYFASSILPYKVSYIRDLCRKRIIPYEKPKGKYVFYRNKLEEWVKQNGSDYKVELLSIGKRVNRKRC